MTEQREAPRLERLRPSRRTETELLNAWAAQISSAPNLAGALCKGSPDWDHDREREPSAEREERLARAIAACRRCPVLAQCRAWVDGLPKHRRPYGAVGGRIVRPPNALAPTAIETKSDRARAWLADYLGHGEPVPVAQIVRAAAVNGLDASILRHVRESAGVERVAPRCWVLPKPEGRNTPSQTAPL